MAEIGSYTSLTLCTVPHGCVLFIEGIKEIGLYELTLGLHRDIDPIFMGKYVLNFQITYSYKISKTCHSKTSFVKFRA